MTSRVRIEPLTAAHDRAAFSSGVEPLDRYFRELATQDIRRRVSNCFVAVSESDAIVGFYTFAATSLPISDMLAEQAKKLPRYPQLPAALIGRLAVDRRFQGQGIGGALLFDAIERAARAETAVFALIAEAKDERAVAFYKRFGFTSFANRPFALYLPVATGLRALRDAGLA